MPADLLALIAELYDQQAELFLARLKDEGITWSEFQILSLVQSEKGPCWQADVARKLGITPPSLCETVQGLVATGLIEQRSSDVDRRVKMLTLTPQAGNILSGLREFHKAMSDEICGSIAPGHRVIAENVMRRMGSSLERISKSYSSSSAI